MIYIYSFGGKNLSKYIKNEYLSKTSVQMINNIYFIKRIYTYIWMNIFRQKNCSIPEPCLVDRSLIKPRERHALGLFLLVAVLNIDNVKLTLSKHNLPFVSVYVLSIAKITPQITRLGLGQYCSRK